MTATLVERLGALGDLTLTHSWDPMIYALLRKDALLRIWKGEKLYAPSVVTRRGGDARQGITIGGRDPRTLLGHDNWGPVIERREFLAGTTRLSNGDFSLLDPAIPTHALFWTFTEGTSWQAGGGAVALNPAVVPLKDDVLLATEQPPALAGQQWEAKAFAGWPTPGTHPEGKLRLRLIWFGHFDNPELLTNPDFELGPGDGWGTAFFVVVETGGARTGTYALRAGPIPKPQLISNSGFESGITDWTLGPTFSLTTAVFFSGAAALACAPNPKPQSVTNSDFAAGSAGWSADTELSFLGGFLTCEPIPYPQYLINPDFELGAGYPWAVPTTGDVGFVNDATKAHDGNWAIKVGPIAQKQLILNTGFEVAGQWYINSDVADPDSSIYFLDPGEGMEGTQAITTQGHTGTPNQKFLRAQFAPGETTTVTPATVIPGEEYIIEGWVWAAPSTDGRAFLYGHIPHPTVANHERWYPSQTLEGSQISSNPAQWKQLTSNVSIPPNRVALNVGMTVIDHHAGYWHWDNITLTRTRGNRSRMDSVAYPVVANSSYRLSALVRSGDGHTDGSTRIGVTLTGPGLVDEVHDVDQGPTDFVWTSVSVDFTPTDGYTGAIPYIMGVDVNGDAMYLDDMLLEKTSNNTRQTNHSSFPITANQRYTLAADVLSGPNLTRGSVTIGAILSGAGLADKEISISSDTTKFQLRHISTDVTPEDGYTDCVVYVRSQDIEGDNFYVDNVTWTKADNNTDSTTHASFPVIPNQHYRLAATVKSPTETTNGTVIVTAVLSGTGLADKEVPTSTDLTKAAWAAIDADVTPPAGYTSCVIRVESKDIEGGNFYVDDVTLTKVDNNTDTIVGTAFPITPERSYRWLASVRSGTNLQSGTVALSVRFTAPGRPDEVIPSSPMGDTKGEWQLLTFDFTPPSGYTMAIPSVIGTDIDGDVFHLDDMSLSDADRTTRVIDLIATATGDLTIGATAPEGTEKVGVALVAEAGGFSWAATSVVLHRTGEAIPTAAEVVDALLHDPVSGDYLLLPGNIVGTDTLRHDWLIEWQSLRASLIHLSTAGVVEPLREDRVRMDDNGDLRYDWATPEQLYTDRGALVLTNSQPVVIDGVGVDENTENQVERVVVIGATKADAKGRPVQIIGVASNAPTDNDWRTNPITRTLVVTDSSAETVAYANSLARYHLDRAAVSVVNVSANLANWEALSSFDVGDWVWPENRDAGLEDDTGAVELGGETIFPKRERVVARTTKMGQEEFRAEVLDTSTGEWVPLPGVGWEKATTAQVELGTVKPDFLADPQNGSTITQFNEFALSNGR